MYPTPANLAEDGILTTSFLQTVQGNFFSILTIPACSLLIIIFVLLTNTLNV